MNGSDRRGGQQVEQKSEIRGRRYWHLVCCVLMIVAAICIGVRIWYVNANAVSYPTVHYQMGEVFKMSGTFFDKYEGEGDMNQGYSLVVDSAEALTPNEYLSHYAKNDRDKNSKKSEHKDADERSVVCVTCTFTNSGNDGGAVFVDKMQLIPPEKNCAWELDDELWSAAYPQIADEMSSAFSLLKDTSYTCQIPFSLEKRADYFDDYENTGRVPVTSDRYSLLVANAPVESWIDITL